MKILVSGASGYIGRNLIKALKAVQHEVVAIKVFRKCEVSFERQKLYIDEQLKDIEKQLYDIDAFVHLAWIDVTKWNSSVHIDINKPLSEYLISRLAYRGIKHIIVAGTCLEYGTSMGVLCEEASARPENKYAQAKHGLYESVKVIASEQGCRLSWLRIFNIYGGDQPVNTIFGSLMEHLERGGTTFKMSSGKQVKDYLHIDELCRMLVSIASSNKEFGVVNICSGQGRPLEKHVRGWLKEISPQSNLSLRLGELPDRVGEPSNLCGNPGKFHSLIK